MANQNVSRGLSSRRPPTGGRPGRSAQAGRGASGRPSSGRGIPGRKPPTSGRGVPGRRPATSGRGTSGRRPNVNLPGRMGRPQQKSGLQGTVQKALKSLPTSGSSGKRRGGGSKGKPALALLAGAGALLGGRQLAKRRDQGSETAYESPTTPVAPTPGGNVADGPLGGAGTTGTGTSGIGTSGIGTPGDSAAPDLGNSGTVAPEGPDSTRGI
jgi:hypothetical protein